MGKQYQAETQIKSSRSIQAIDITKNITNEAKKSGIEQGSLLLHVPHTTAALILNEAEPGLLADIEKMAASLIPENDWQHDRIDNNASAHLVAALSGSSLPLIWSGSKPLLGTWQSIIFLEMDGPRTRTVHLLLSSLD